MPQGHGHGSVHRIDDDPLAAHTGTVLLWRSHGGADLPVAVRLHRHQMVGQPACDLGQRAARAGLVGRILQQAVEMMGLTAESVQRLSGMAATILEPFAQPGSGRLAAFQTL